MKKFIFEQVYSQALHEKNKVYTESQIEEILCDNEMHVETHRMIPGYFDATIVTGKTSSFLSQLVGSNIQ